MYQQLNFAKFSVKLRHLLEIYVILWYIYLYSTWLSVLFSSLLFSLSNIFSSICLLYFYFFTFLSLLIRISFSLKNNEFAAEYWKFAVSLHTWMCKHQKHQECSNFYKSKKNKLNKYNKGPPIFLTGGRWGFGWKFSWESYSFFAQTLLPI